MTSLLQYEVIATRVLEPELGAGAPEQAIFSGAGAGVGAHI